MTTLRLRTRARVIRILGPRSVMLQPPGRSIANILTVVCVTAALGACGQADEARARVSLLPSTKALGSAWDWTSACRFGPRSPSGCEASGPDLGVAQLAGNAWNLGGPATAGSVRMSVNSSGGLEVNGNLSSAPP